MKEKIERAMRLLKKDYDNGNLSQEEYHNQLNGLNNVVWEMDRYKLLEDVKPNGIQNKIHEIQEGIY